MGTFTFNIDQVPGAPVDADSAKTFKITGPNTLTQAQAQAIFEKQVKTGGLTGFKAGDVLNAATQVADGLKSAQAQLTSGISSIGASVSKATNGITSALAKTGVANGIDPGNFVKALVALVILDLMLGSWKKQDMSNQVWQPNMFLQDKIP